MHQNRNLKKTRFNIENIPGSNLITHTILSVFTAKVDSKNVFGKNTGFHTYIVIDEYSKLNGQPKAYRGSDCVDKFLEYMKHLMDEIMTIYTITEPLGMSIHQENLLGLTLLHLFCQVS